MITWSNVRLGALLVVLMLAVAATAVTRHTGGTSTVQGAVPVIGGERQTKFQTKARDSKAYADRPPGVQAVMRAMYNNDRRYLSLSGLFVDEAPNDTANSIQLAIQQPYSVTAEWYPDATGSGTPGEELHSGKVSATLYSPAKNVTTALTQIQNQPPLQPIDSVETGVVVGTFSPTDVTFSNGTAASLVNMFVHPASLITSSFFTYKDVQLAGTGSWDGRATWVLSGTQDPQAPSMALLGDGWRMEVDQHTGVILRLDYLQDGKTIGWAGFQSFAATAPGALTGRTLPALRIPRTAKTLAPQAYAQAAALPWLADRAAGQALGLHTSIVAQGVQLTLTVPRTSYPRDALGAFTVRVMNRSKSPVEIIGFPWYCDETYNPGIQVLNGSNQPVYPPGLPHFSPLCPGPTGAGLTLRPHQSVSRTVYAIVRSTRIEAMVNVQVETGPSTYTQSTISSSPLTVRLTNEPRPNIMLHGSGAGLHAVVQPRAHLHGPLFFIATTSCTTNSNGGITGGGDIWAQASGDRLDLGCSPVRTWEVIAGWVNHPVAKLEYTAGA